MLLPEEWQWLRSITFNSPERYGVSGLERVLCTPQGSKPGYGQTSFAL